MEYASTFQIISATSDRIRAPKTSRAHITKQVRFVFYEVSGYSFIEKYVVRLREQTETQSAKSFSVQNRREVENDLSSKLILQAKTFAQHFET